MPTTRSASLRVAHQKGCAHRKRSSLDSLTSCNGTCEPGCAGCSCKRPSYFTLHRNASGKPEASARVRDRRVAERALRKLQVTIDEGRVGIKQPKPSAPTLGEWLDQYLHIVEFDRKRKPGTVRAYGETKTVIEKAKLDGVPLDEIGQPELRGLVSTIREGGAGDASVDRHLRHLVAIFNQAIDDELVDKNPVPKFRRSLRLKIPRGTEAFADVELAKLWVAMAKHPGVYSCLLKASVTTGARVGELIAADWGDLDLTGRKLHIRHTYDRVADELVAPKDNEARTVHLIPAAVSLLEAWTAQSGVQPDDSPIFPAPERGGRLSRDYISKLVRTALAEAGVPLEAESGRRRKPVHSLRATFTRICLESGAAPQWVQAELGHADPDLTINVYGTWSESAKQAAADGLEAEHFTV